MSKFSKFLENNEVLVAVGNRQENNRIFYLIIFLVLPVIFFLLYPLLQTGREGLILWLVLLALWFILLFKQALKQKGLYLLTDRRIIYLKLKNQNDYSQFGQINLAKIISLKNDGKNNICLLTKNGRYYLIGLANRAEFYRRIVSLKQQNLL